jgi:hypothetical protein
VVYTIEENLFNMTKANLSDIVSTGMAIPHTTIDKSRVNEVEVEIMKKELEFLRNQVDYYHGYYSVVGKFKEDIQEEDHRHAQVRMKFVPKVAELQEETL